MSAKTPKPPRNMISVKHAAYLSNVSETTILRLIRRGDLPAKLVGHKYHLYIDDVKLVVQKYKIQAEESRKNIRGKDIPSNKLTTFDEYVVNHRLVIERDRQNITNNAVTF